jgi:hypothetical protein
VPNQKRLSRILDHEHINSSTIGRRIKYIPNRSAIADDDLTRAHLLAILGSNASIHEASDVMKVGTERVGTVVVEC